MPAMIRSPFVPDLLTITPFANGVKQLNAVAIDCPQDQGQGRELVGPRPMRGQEPKQPRPFRQRGKQFASIAPHPAIKGRIAAPFKRKEDSQGDDFARPQVSQGAFRDIRRALIYSTEQLLNKVFGRHVESSSYCLGVATLGLEPSHGTFRGPRELAPLVTRKARRQSRRKKQRFGPTTHQA